MIVVNNQFSPSLLLMLLVSLISCQERASQNLTAVSNKISEETVPVKTVPVKIGTFNEETIVNGQINAFLKASIRYESSGIIRKILVSEGQWVQEGQILALLFEKRKGKYGISETAQEPVLSIENENDQTTLAKSLPNKESSGKGSVFVLRAPLSGRVADMRTQFSRFFLRNDEFCTILNDHQMFVDFSVIEQELNAVRRAELIEITPFSQEDHRYTGKITSINPIIDRFGLIKVSGIVRNDDGRLIDGMRVKISIQRQLKNQIIIPKSAILEKGDRKVVFTVVKGKAIWNYVDVINENSSVCAVKSGLKVGDSVIYEGNFNLSHEKNVEMINN